MGCLCPAVRDWDTQVGSEYDSALTGRQPHLETAKRALTLESSSLLGQTTIAVFWDAAKFFDSIEGPRLIRSCIELGFPLDVMILGLQAHRAPRSLKALGTMTQPMPRVGRSIIAGCTLSTSFARA